MIRIRTSSTRPNSAVDVLKNGEVDLSLKKKFFQDLTQIVENQNPYLTKLLFFHFDKDGKKSSI